MVGKLIKIREIVDKMLEGYVEKDDVTYIELMKIKHIITSGKCVHFLDGKGLLCSGWDARNQNTTTKRKEITCANCVRVLLKQGRLWDFKEEDKE